MLLPFSLWDMDSLSLSEHRTLLFHAVFLDEARNTPNLIARAKDQISAMRERNPKFSGVMDRWSDLLETSIDEMSRQILEDTPDGGLLRSVSPMISALAPSERNTFWTRVGLRQFVGWFFAATRDLGFSAKECAAVSGTHADTIAEWHKSPPATMTRETLERLKILVSVYQALIELISDAEARRVWLHQPVAKAEMSPFEMIADGNGYEVRDQLNETVRSRMRASSR